jgi:two-component system sensor histidine kinase FlrB
MSSHLATAEPQPILSESSVDAIRVTEPELKPVEHLESAFSLFNEMSSHLSSSYQQMEEKVGLLNGQLSELAEQRLQELNEKERVTHRLESLLKLLPAGVLVLDNKGIITKCNPAAADLLGEPLEGELWRDIILRSFAPRSDDGHEISLNDGRRISIATRSFEDGDGQLLLLTDLTETRQLQQNLSRHQRLSEMGRMMSSLAHQIRTPVSAAMLYAGHLCNSELSAEQTKRFSHKVLSRLEHMEQQIKAMLIFVKGDVKLTDTVTVSELLVQLEAAMDVPMSGSRSIYHIDNRFPEAALLCNSESLIGALMNLVNNAIQSVGSGVELFIKTERSPQGHLQLAICDNGPGIPEHVARNIEEPFYTTKAQGTGLGLAVVRAVIQAHKGNFSLESVCGEGSCAIIELPLAGEQKAVVSEVEHEQ